MDRITPKEVLSMMDAVAQVYEQPEVEQLDEIVRNLRPGETIKQYDERKKREAEAAAKNTAPAGAFNISPKGSEKRRELEAQIKRDNAARTAAKNTAPAGSFNISPEGSEKRKELEAQIKRDNAARTDDQRVQPKPADTKPADTKPADTKPQLTDQQKVRAEYDRLRYSKDPKERAQAAGYGKAMASAGATNKDFSGYKSAADLAKSNSNNSRTIPGVMSNKSASGSGPGGYQIPAGARPIKSATPAAAGSAAATPAAAGSAAAKPAPTPAVKAPATPAAKPAGSIADRLQQIRDMRARSQSRITAQGGTLATPAVNPTPKATPPSTTGATTTPTVKPAAKVDKKQPLRNGDPMERMTGKGAASLMETYSKVYEEREPQAIDEGIMGALKKVGKAVIGPADQSPEAEAARMGKRRPQGEIQRKNAVKMQRVLDAENNEEVDLFDVIKGHFIEEGLTEEEALAKMIDLTDEERTEIIEGLGSLIRAGASAIRNRMQSGTVRTPNINLPRGGGAGAAGSLIRAGASAIRNRMQSGTVRTPNINLPRGGGAGGRPTSAPAKPRGEDIFTSTPPGGKPYGNKKKLPAPGTPAGKNAPLRDEPLF